VPALPPPPVAPPCGDGSVSPRADHDTSGRKNHQFGLCGGADHWPPHVCTHHIRRREYYGMIKGSSHFTDSAIIS